jgi:hypothetical protein
MISSPDIDKFLRKYLSPILRENGFTKVSAGYDFFDGTRKGFSA